MDLRDRTYIVSGGAGRIGAQICRGIVRYGGNVTIVDIDSVRGSLLASELGDEHALFVNQSVTQRASVDSVVADTVRHFGSIDGAVHSAYPRSAGWGARFEELIEKNLAEDLRLQLGGTIVFAQGIVEALRATNRGGALVLISSIQSSGAPKFRHYAGTTMTSPIEYSAIKAGVNAVARYLAKYLIGENIRVNTVSPGGIRDTQPTDFLERYRQECVNKGMLDAEDVVGTVCFLLSDNSTFITGQNIIVDDGWSV